jgi:hypothetical protein
MRTTPAALALVGVLAATPSCTPGQRAVARSVLDAATFACVLLSSLSDEEAVARTCRVEEAARPALREALAGRAAAARVAGVPAGAPICAPATAPATAPLPAGAPVAPSGAP